MPMTEDILMNMDDVCQVHVLDKTVYILLQADITDKPMYPSILP